MWARYDAIRNDPARLSEVEVKMKDLLSQPVSLALLEEVKALVAKPGDRTPEEITNICENVFRMNCIHRMQAWGAIRVNKKILLLTHATIVQVIVYTAAPLSDEFVSDRSDMPPANMDGLDFVAAYMLKII